MCFRQLVLSFYDQHFAMEIYGCLFSQTKTKVSGSDTQARPPVHFLKISCHFSVSMHLMSPLIPCHCGISASPDKAPTATRNSDTSIESQNHTSNKLEATAERIDTTYSLDEQAATFLKLFIQAFKLCSVVLRR